MMIDDVRKCIVEDGILIYFDDIIKVEKVSMGNLKAVCVLAYVYDDFPMYHFFFEGGMALEAVLDRIGKADGAMRGLFEQHKNKLDTSHMFLAGLLFLASEKVLREPEYISERYDFDTMCRYSEMDVAYARVDSADKVYSEIYCVKPKQPKPVKYSFLNKF